jgi:hypothetical protein
MIDVVAGASNRLGAINDRLTRPSLRGQANARIRLGEATKQSRLSPVSLVWIASSLRSLAMTKAGFIAL